MLGESTGYCVHKTFTLVSFFLQETCCGVNGYVDYQTFTWSNNITYGNGEVFNDAQVPLSCCMMKVPGQVAASVSEFINYQQCLTAADSYTNIKVLYFLKSWFLNFIHPIIFTVK